MMPALKTSTPAFHSTLDRSHVTSAASKKRPARSKAMSGSWSIHTNN